MKRFYNGIFRHFGNLKYGIFLFEFIVLIHRHMAFLYDIIIIVVWDKFSRYLNGVNLKCHVSPSKLILKYEWL